MDLDRKIYKTLLNGEEATLEVSKLAGKANAAVLARHGETAVLAVVVMDKTDSQADFFPLTVDYEERFYAAGKIMGSRFIRREGRPSDEATLSARLIDRTIRPLFDHRIRRAIQVTITVLAYDGKHDPDAISLLAVSTALGISDIPWNGPVGVSSDKDSFFSGPKGKVNMIELGGENLSEDRVLEMFEKSQKDIDQLVDFQENIISEIGKPKIKLEFKEASVEAKKLADKIIENSLEKALLEKTVSDLKSEFLEQLAHNNEDENLGAASEYFEKKSEEFVKTLVIKKKKRVDGRRLDEVRELYAEVGLFKRTHGSALFIRGETQILAVTTLAPPSAEQLIETLEFAGSKRFLLHYNFPKFSTGETGRSRSPGRREIGHGALAQKALAAFVPPKDDFPYTIRVVAETLSSNGSTSMATTCAASLAMMDAGVPIKSQVAGIAMGLMKLGDEWEVITDIQGPEDHYGDMDLKIAGTEEGISAIQMDVKLDGISKDIFAKALPMAKKARLEILKVMNKALPKPRAKLSPYAPIIKIITIDPERIGEVIGPGGKTINGMIAAAGGDVSIDIEENGQVYVSGSDPEKVEKAMSLVKDVVREYKVGDIIEGTVAKILDFGAIVEWGMGHSGMIHVSELADKYVQKVTDVVKVGDKVRAKITKMENGKTGLTLKGVK